MPEEDITIQQRVIMVSMIGNQFVMNLVELPTEVWSGFLLLLLKELGEKASTEGKYATVLQSIISACEERLAEGEW